MFYKTRFISHVSVQEGWEKIITSLYISPGVNGREPRDVMSPTVAGEEPGYSVCNVSLLDVASLLQQKVRR